MVVKERSPLDSAREFLAELLRSLASFIAPEPDRGSEILDHAPIDDEPVTAEDKTAIDKAWHDYRSGEAISLDEVKRELG